jgi:hypothetical protein
MSTVSSYGDVLSPHVHVANGLGTPTLLGLTTLYNVVSFIAQDNRHCTKYVTPSPEFFNPLAPEFYIYILAHPVCKM